MNDQICPTQKGRNLGFFAYQRLAENTGLVEKSSVTAFLDGYAPYNYTAKEDDNIKVTIENNSVFLGVDIQEKNIISTDRKDIRNFAC